MSFTIQSGLSEHSSQGIPSVSSLLESSSSLLSATTHDLKTEVAALEAALGINSNSVEEFGLSPRSKKKSSSHATGISSQYENHLIGLQRQSSSMSQGHTYISNLSIQTTGLQTTKAQTNFSQASMLNKSSSTRRLSILLNRHSKRAREA